MEIIITVLVAALIALVVYLIMGAVEPLRPYAQIGAVITFILVVLSRLGEL